MGFAISPAVRKPDYQTEKSPILSVVPEDQLSLSLEARRFAGQEISAWPEPGRGETLKPDLQPSGVSLNTEWAMVLSPARIRVAKDREDDGTREL